MAQSTAVSLKYQVVRQNYDRLTREITDGLHEVVTKAFARNLITLPTKNACLNDSNPTDQRAEKFMDTLLGKVQFDDTFFHTFVSILHELPALSHLAKKLEDEVIGEGDSADVGERKSDIHSDIDKEYPTHSGKRDARHQSGSWSRKIAKAKQNSENEDSAVADLSTSSRPEKEDSEPHELVHLHNSAYNVPMLELYTHGHHFSLGEGGEEDGEDPQRLPTSSTNSSNQADCLPGEKEPHRSTQEAGRNTNGGSIVMTTGAAIMPRDIPSTSSVNTLDEIKNLQMENKHKEAEVEEKDTRIKELERMMEAKEDQIKADESEISDLKEQIKTFREQEREHMREKELYEDQIQDLNNQLAGAQLETMQVKLDYDERIQKLQKDLERTKGIKEEIAILLANTRTQLAQKETQLARTEKKYESEIYELKLLVKEKTVNEERLQRELAQVALEVEKSKREAIQKECNELQQTFEIHRNTSSKRISELEGKLEVQRSISSNSSSTIDDQQNTIDEQQSTIEEQRATVEELKQKLAKLEM